MRGKIPFILVALLLFLPPKSGQAYGQVSAESAVLMEHSTGRVLYDKQAHTKQSIASLTKVMTAIIAIESGHMKDIVQVSRRAIHTTGSSIYLEQGEKMSLEDLVYGLMLRSGNDAAVAIAEHIGGSVEGFVHLMNEKADWIGMTNTNFTNPHGLEGEGHYSTAYDVALLLRYAMSNPVFQDISGTKMYQAKSRTYTWQNKNKLLTQLYPFCTGGKTGYTRKAGRTLATTSHKNNMDLISVTLNAPADWKDHISLYEWAYDHYDMTSLGSTEKYSYEVKDTKEKFVGETLKSLLYPLTNSERQLLQEKTILYDDVNKNSSIVGRTVFHLNGEVLLISPIVPSDNQMPNNFIEQTAYVFKQIIKLEASE